MTPPRLPALLLAAALLGCRAAPSPAPEPTAPAVRVVTVGQSYSLAGIFTRVSLREHADGRVTGSVLISTGEANRRSQARAYGCRMQREGEDDTQSFRCTLPFPRGAPDWAAVLARLDALGIERPPPPRQPPAGTGYICNDGTPWGYTVEYPSQPGRVPVSDRQACAPPDPARSAFEDGVLAVLRDVMRAAEAE